MSIWHGDESQGCQRSGKSKKKKFFKVREFCKKSEKIFEYGKVREKSGNFVMNARDTCFITVLHLYVPYFSALYGPRWENPCFFFDAM